MHFLRRINMKTSSLKFLSAILAVGFFGAAHAQRVTSGAIDFRGNITPATCEIDSNTRSLLVEFGAVPPDRTGFQGNGNTVVAGDVATPAYTKTFTIRLLGCTAATATNNQPQNARFRFSGANSQRITTDGTLTTTNSSVNIQILESGIPLNMNNLSSLFALTAAPVIINYGARYQVAANTTLTTGVADSSATFTLNYP
jgi:type 1 fimbria pilin